MFNWFHVGSRPLVLFIRKKNQTRNKKAFKKAVRTGLIFNSQMASILTINRQYVAIAVKVARKKGVGASTGFEPVDPAFALQCSTS